MVQTGGQRGRRTGSRRQYNVQTLRALTPTPGSRNGTKLVPDCNSGTRNSTRPNVGGAVL
eukprot:275775-Rhodomonas_salina.1